MKKVVFFGDGILCHPSGYAEQLVDNCILHHPITQFESYLMGEPLLTLDSVQKNIPGIVGKAPNLILIGVGHADFLKPAIHSVDTASWKAMIKVLLLKTQAQLVLTTVCTAFVPEENRPFAQQFNSDLTMQINDRIRILDLDSPISLFLSEHRSGLGEKRALHGNGLSLTSMGRVLLAHEAYFALPWDGFLND